MSKSYAFYPYVNRTLCNVLEAMRSMDKTKNYSMLLSLVEEGQLLANRMESKLDDRKEVEDWTEVREEMKRDMKQLQKEIKALEKKKANLTKGTKK